MAANARTTPTVIALHCSGGTGQQWRHLAQALGDGYSLHAPDLIGTEVTGNWPGDGPFTLGADAAPVCELIDRTDAPVHLVGHSFGGGVALRVAAMRPHRLASLTLYEPTPFHVLRSAGDAGRVALGEIRRVAGQMERAVLLGDYAASALQFIDYWSQAGSFAALKPAVRRALVGYAAKACLDFRALLGERLPLAAYRRITTRILILQGAETKQPPAVIARKLARVMPGAQHQVLPGMGHMGPVTHAAAVAAAMAAHIRSIPLDQQERAKPPLAA